MSNRNKTATPEVARKRTRLSKQVPLVQRHDLPLDRKIMLFFNRPAGGARKEVSYGQ
jgi:hypothetical protein